MKIFDKLFLLVFAMVFLYGCSPQINVVKVSNTKEPSKKNGFYYALPRTLVKVDVVVSKTEQIKGPYAEFAEKYLGLTQVIKNNSTSYDISGYKISTFTEPDPQQFYFVETKSSCPKKLNRFRLALDEAGMILGTKALLDTVASEKQVYVFEEGSNVYPDIFKSYADLNMFEKVDTIIEKVNVDSMMVEKMTFKRSMVEKTPDQKAKNAADFIIKVKENRFNLISGFQEVNYDKETFKYMNEELEKMENEYRKLFTGIIFTKKITYSFVYVPDPSRPVDSVALFRFSKLHGMLETGDVYGDEVYLSIKKSGNTDSLSTYVSKKDLMKTKSHGFYYRLPDYAEVWLYNSIAKNISGKFLISQYGVLTSLPAETRRFEVYPETGAIRNVGGK